MHLLQGGDGQGEVYLSFMNFDMDHCMTRTIWLALTLLLSPSLMAATEPPRPGKLEVYKDWIVGCDNGGACTAVSLIPESSGFSEAFASVSVFRDPGPAAQPSVRLRFFDGVAGLVRISVDGRLIATANASGEGAVVRGPRGSALALAIALGNRMEIHSDGELIGSPSLAGSSAALRYMDARQGRAGTITALVAAGPLPSGSVKAATALPRLVHAPVPRHETTPSLTKAERIEAEKLTGCDPQFDMDRAPDLFPLGNGRTLVMLPCGSGAYNFASAALIATGSAGKRQFAPARFDFQPAWGEGDFPTLVNHGWDATRSTLSSYAKGRGLGDCGSAESYVWDGSGFRLVQASSMSECRGALEWITTWRATVAGS